MSTEPILKEKEFENVVPFRPFGMFDEMERMLESVMGRNWMRPMGWKHGLPVGELPMVDIVDRDDHILLRAAIPGVKADDLEVSTTDHTVTIRGRAGYDIEKETGEYYRHELGGGVFLRTITLPASIDEAKTKAVFRDGLLELTLPKLESAKRHTIAISSE